MENFPYFVRDLTPSLYGSQIKKLIKVNQQTRLYLNSRRSMQSYEDIKNMLFEIEKLKSELQKIMEGLATLKQAEIHTQVTKTTHGLTIDELKQIQQEFFLSIEEYICNQENGLNQIQFQLQHRPPTFYTTFEESADSQKESSVLFNSIFDEHDFNFIDSQSSSSLESILNKTDFLDHESSSSDELSSEGHRLINDESSSSIGTSSNEQDSFSKFQSFSSFESSCNSGAFKNSELPSSNKSNQNPEIKIDTFTSFIGQSDSVEEGEPEDENHGLVNLFDSLPSGYPVKSILTNGNEFYVSYFINYEPEHQLVYFSGNEHIITIECNEIDGIIFDNES